MIPDVAEAPSTRLLAEYIAAAHIQDLPAAVRRESCRALLNILGCMFGGSRHEIVGIVTGAFANYAGPPQASLLGLGKRTDILHASYVNCLSSSVDSFDDNHSANIIHPSGPVAAVLLALTETIPTTGASFVQAFALGIETILRVSRSIAVPPAKGNLAWVQTGLAGGVGCAAAAGKLLGLDAQKLAWAMGIAGSQGAGYRGNHGTMCTPLMPAQAARSGLEAAILAARGFTSSETTLEGKYGFCRVFAKEPDLGAITHKLGETYDLLGLTYKPYPSGVVLNPVIEASLRVRALHDFSPDAVARIEVAASPTAVAITDRRHPKDELAAQLSLQHWVASAIATGEATTANLSLACIAAPLIASLRERVEPKADAQLLNDAAAVTVTLHDGETFSARVEHCIGSADCPMSDADIEKKFCDQAGGIITDDNLQALISLCGSIDELDDLAILHRTIG